MSATSPSPTRGRKDGVPAARNIQHTRRAANRRCAKKACAVHESNRQPSDQRRDCQESRHFEEGRHHHQSVRHREENERNGHQSVRHDESAGGEALHHQLARPPQLMRLLHNLPPCRSHSRLDLKQSLCRILSLATALVLLAGTSNLRHLPHPRHRHFHRHGQFRYVDHRSRGEMLRSSVSVVGEKKGRDGGASADGRFGKAETSGHESKDNDIHLPGRTRSPIQHNNRENTDSDSSDRIVSPFFTSLFPSSSTFSAVRSMASRLINYVRSAVESTTTTQEPMTSTQGAAGRNTTTSPSAFEIDAGAQRSRSEAFQDDVKTNLTTLTLQRLDSCRLFVGGIHPKTSTRELRMAFEAHGEVLDVMIPRTGGDKRARGFAFVAMGNRTQMDRVLGKVVKVGDRLVECKEARPSHKGPRRDQPQEQRVPTHTTASMQTQPQASASPEIGGGAANRRTQPAAPSRKDSATEKPDSNADEDRGKGGELGGGLDDFLQLMERTRMAIPRYHRGKDLMKERSLLCEGRRVFQRDHVKAEAGVGKRFYAMTDDEAWKMITLLPKKEIDLYETLEEGRQLCAFQDVDGPKTYYEVDSKYDSGNLTVGGDMILKKEWQALQKQRYLEFIAPAVQKFFAEKCNVSLGLSDVLIADSSGFGFRPQYGLYWKPSFHWKVAKVRFSDLVEQRRFWRHFQPSKRDIEEFEREDQTNFSSLWDKDDVYTRNRAWRMVYSCKRIGNEVPPDRKLRELLHRPMVPLHLEQVSPIRYSAVENLNRATWKAHSIFSIDKNSVSPSSRWNTSVIGGDEYHSNHSLLRLGEEEFRQHLKNSVGKLLNWKTVPRAKRMRYYWQIFPDVACVSGKKHKAGGNKMLARPSGDCSILLTCPGRNCQGIRVAFPLPKQVRPPDNETEFSVRFFYSNGSRINYTYVDQ